MKRTIYIFLLYPFLCFADDIGLEEHLWASSSGRTTTPTSIQDNTGGYIVIDEDGNESWIDSLEEPKCSFTSTQIEYYGDRDFIDDEISSEVYIGNLDLGDCNE